MLSFLLRIEKLKLSNYTLWNLLSFFNGKVPQKRIDSIFQHKTTQETIKTVLEENQNFIESNDNVKKLVQKLLDTREGLFSAYLNFIYYGKLECKFTINEIEKHIKQFIESEGKTPNNDELYEVLQRFNFLKERSPEILGLKDKFFETVRKLIFNPESSSDERFALFFNERRFDAYNKSGYKIFSLLIENYRLLLGSKLPEDILEIARRDLSEIYDPRIISHFLYIQKKNNCLMQIAFEYSNIIRETNIKNKIQNHWLHDLKLREMPEAAFNQCLWDIKQLWKDYFSKDAEFMNQFIDKYPEMSLQIIEEFRRHSNNRQTPTTLQSSYTLVDQNNTRKGSIDGSEIYNKGNFEYVNKFGSNLKKALYESIKKLIPQELFELLNNTVLQSKKLPFHPKLYTYNENQEIHRKSQPALNHDGIMFCLFYEEELKQMESLEIID